MEEVIACLQQSFSKINSSNYESNHKLQVTIKLNTRNTTIPSLTFIVVAVAISKIWACEDFPFISYWIAFVPLIYYVNETLANFIKQNMEQKGKRRNKERGPKVGHKGAKAQIMFQMEWKCKDEWVMGETD